MEKTITPQDLKALLASGQSVTLLDVRRPADFDADPVKLPGARWRDPDKIGEWSTHLSPGETIVIYCAHGRSISNSVVDHLRANGLAARFIAGGIAAWKESGGGLAPK